MGPEAKKIKTLIESGELSYSSDNEVWQIGPFTGKTPLDVYRGWKAQTHKKKPTRQERLDSIFWQVATYGEVTKEALRHYVEGRIAYKTFKNTVNKGLQANERKQNNDNTR